MKSCQTMVNAGRRQFLRGGALAAAGAAATVRCQVKAKPNRCRRGSTIRLPGWPMLPS